MHVRNLVSRTVWLALMAQAVIAQNPDVQQKIGALEQQVQKHLQAQKPQLAIPVLREADGHAFARAIRDDRISVRSDGLEMSFALPRLAAAILARTDGQRSLAEIKRLLESEASVRAAAFDKDFAALYKVMNGIGRMTIRRARS